MTLQGALRSFCTLLICGLVFPHSGAGQAAGGGSKEADYSKEPYVVERNSTTAEFRSDGTRTVVYAQRTRIQSQAALQDFGVLKFPYASANTSLEITKVRVIKPDGRAVETPSENVMELPAEVTRDAPFYSDLKEKHVAVRGLETGDELEYEFREVVHTPIDPGQFWWSYRFFDGGIVLENNLEISVPRERYVKVQSSGPQPSVEEKGALRIYRWKTANLTAKPPKAPSAFGDHIDLAPPAVQVTTFHDWQEVGKWFAGLAEPRAVPTPDIRAKAKELTRGAKDNTEKMEALYTYVSEKFRYISISLGIGRYQPHTAADVLANNYGDCKDKHTLLASLLAAEGIEAYPALINSTTKVDPDVPSPGQFDHLITVVWDGKNYIWLDTTLGVAPFGFLAAGLRGKQALVMPMNGPAELMKTPADPPFPSLYEFRSDGTLDSAGTLNATMQIKTRGDSEVIFRYALRNIGHPQWKDVIQQMSYALGFAGDVSDVSASDPGALGEVFRVQYKYTRKNYSDWENKRVLPLVPPVGLPEIPADFEKDPKPIPWDKTQTLDLVANLTLPAGAQPTLSPNVDLKNTFGAYAASYSFTDGVLHTERRLTWNENTISVADVEAYRKFRKAITDDESNLIPIYASSTSPGDTHGTPEARDLFEKGREAWEQHDMPKATATLQSAVEKDPRFAAAWMVLGDAHVIVGDTAHGIQELKNALALDPSLKEGYRILGDALMGADRLEEALSMWMEVAKNDPLDAEAPRQVAAVLFSLKRYSDAVPLLEASVSSHPGDATLLYALGFAYIKTGNVEKGMSAFQNATALDSSPNMLNMVASELSENNLRLSDAEKYAQRAVAGLEQKTSTIAADNLHFEDLMLMLHLPSSWDTLGWICFQQGQLDDANRYLTAGWDLSQDPTIADHLGQVLEKQGKRKEAIQAYARAIAAGHAPEETRRRLVAASGKEALADNAVGQARNDLAQLRTTKLGRLLNKEVSAEFFIVLGQQGKTADFRFIKGADELRDVAKAIPAEKFHAIFPDAGPTKLLRRGILVCEPTVSGCVVALMIPTDVRSLN